VKSEDVESEEWKNKRESKMNIDIQHSKVKNQS
jgi:hypothetical protein